MTFLWYSNDCGVVFPLKERLKRQSAVKLGEIASHRIIRTIVLKEVFDSMVHAANLQLFIDVVGQNRRANTTTAKRTIPVDPAKKKSIVPRSQARDACLLAASCGQGSWVAGGTEHQSCCLSLGAGAITILAEIPILTFPWPSPAMDLGDQYFQTRSSRMGIIVLLGHVPMRTVIKRHTA